MTTPEELKREYQSAGFRRLGGGLYGECFAKPGADWCIKTGYRQQNGRYDGYLAYVQFAILNGWIGNAAPYIYSIKTIGTSYVVVMERLALCWGDAIGAANNLAASQRKTAEWETRVSLVSDKIETLRSEGHDVRRDTHPWNWMLRRNGDLVMTDPIAGEMYHLPLTRWRNPNPRPTITPHPLLG